MDILSHRLGKLEVPEDKIIEMKRPILGFETLTRFCLVEVSEIKPFMLLHSVDEAEVAFMVVNPVVFFPDYKIEVNPKEIAELMIDDVATVETYTIVSVPEDPERISVNLQGPILINTYNNYAKQLVLVNSGYRVHHYIADILEDEAQSIESSQEQPVSV